MKPILSNQQTIITAWLIAIFRWLSVAGLLYFNSRAYEFVTPKLRRGELEKAEPFFEMANMFLWAWVSLILLAVIISLISSKRQRSMVILFQIVVLPSLEFWFVFFW